MQQAYFIRHGNASYRKNSLTHFGVTQVKSLVNNLEARLPEDISCALVSSPDGRAIRTAQEFIPLLEKKAKKTIYINEEQSLSSLASMGRVETLLANGRENTVLIEKYGGSDFGFFISHEAIIVATCLAIAEKYEISLPEFLKLKDFDEHLVTFTMREYSCSREEAIVLVKKHGGVYIPELSSIAEASAIHINFQQKQAEYIQASS